MKPAALVTTILIIAFAVFDLALVTFGGTDSSVSRFLRTTPLKHPVISFGFGFVCGHLFGYMKEKQE